MPSLSLGSLILGDEFDGPAGSKPNSALWTPRTGNSNGAAHYDGLNQVELDGNGNLVVTCAKDASGKWQSAFLSTVSVPHSGQRYLEARAKVAPGGGAWSAPLWEWEAPYGAIPPGQTSGLEIDVNEQLGKQPDAYHATVHNWKKSGTSPQLGHQINGVSPLANAFHVYGAAVYPDHIDFYLDGVLKATTKASQVGLTDFTTFELVTVIDLNIGGWGGTIQVPGPIQMLVDYVHVNVLL